MSINASMLEYTMELESKGVWDLWAYWGFPEYSQITGLVVSKSSNQSGGFSSGLCHKIGPM